MNINNFFTNNNNNNNPLNSVYKHFKKIVCFIILVLIVWLLFNVSNENVIINHNIVDNKYELSISDKNNFSENCTQISRALSEVINSRSEYWNYLSSLIATNADQNGSLLLDSDQLRTLADMNNVLSLDLENLELNINTLHKIQFKLLSDQIQKRIYKNQNPLQTECNTTKMVYCYVHSCCGFASQMDFIVKCLRYAYMTNTTAVILDLIPNYLKHTTHKWDHYITPLSETCQPQYNIKYNATQLPRDPAIKDLPNDKIGKIILDTHPNPKLFWYSQFARYAMRPNLRTKKIIEDSVKKCGFSHPIVGVQIRRGDKIGWESKRHSNDEYMFHVSNYYDKLSLKGYNGAKNVFIASDDSSAVNDLRKRYTDYHFIDRDCFAVSDNKFERRPDNSKDYPNLDYIMLDIHFLSMCDFIVCTLSSNVCRLSYEILASTKSDFSPAVQSLDVQWFVWLDSGKVQREFKYQHKTNSTTLSVNDTAAEEYFYFNLATRGENGFVECMTETKRPNFMLQCPLYKTKVKLYV